MATQTSQQGLEGTCVSDSSSAPAPPQLLLTSASRLTSDSHGLLLLHAPICEKSQHKGTSEMGTPPTARARAPCREELRVGFAFTGYVNSSLNLSEPHCPHQYSRDNSACLPGLSWGLNETVSVQSFIRRVSKHAHAAAGSLAVLLLLTAY